MAAAVASSQSSVSQRMTAAVDSRSGSGFDEQHGPVSDAGWTRRGRDGFRRPTAPSPTYRGFEGLDRRQRRCRVELDCVCFVRAGGGGGGSSIGSGVSDGDGNERDETFGAVLMPQPPLTRLRGSSSSSPPEEVRPSSAVPQLTTASTGKLVGRSFS
jgi:hypothetical protein